MEDAPLWLLSDHLGSTAVAANTDATQHSRKGYKAFGETRFAAGSLPTRYQFTGQASHESDFGLYFYKARWYDPALSRWASPDPIIPELHNPLAFDRYSYAYNNPIRYRDSSGHCIDGVTTIACILGGAMIVGAIASYAIQVADNRESGMGWGDALTTNISGEKIVAGAVIAGGVVVGAVAVGTIVTAGAVSLGLTGTAACADGDCTNEAQAVGQVVQNGANIITNNTGSGYNSFNAFKYAQGPAGSGMAWHHIVEQNPTNISSFGSQAINNTSNLIRLPSGVGLLHQRISGYYSSIQPLVTGSDTLTVRQWLQTKSFEFQWNFGIELIMRFGGAKYIIDQFGDKPK